MAEISLNGRKVRREAGEAGSKVSHGDAKGPKGGVVTLLSQLSAARGTVLCVFVESTISVRPSSILNQMTQGG